MPFFQLTEEDISFPPAYFADSEGLIAVGGDMKPERIIKAYQNGIYFWFGPMDPIKWWSPDPRLILDIGSKISNKPACQKTFCIYPLTNIECTLEKLQKQENLGSMSPQWITEELKSVYSNLNSSGHASALELKENNELYSQILGIRIGSVFFAEYVLVNPELDSSECTDQSLRVLSSYLALYDYTLLDIQKESIRISDIGIQEISRLEYLDKLNRALSKSAIPFSNKTIII